MGSLWALAAAIGVVGRALARSRARARPLAEPALLSATNESKQRHKSQAAYNGLLPVEQYSGLGVEWW